MLGRLITLESFTNAMQATLVKNHLEAVGIRCVLADEFMVSNFWHLSGAVGGIKVQVAEEDFERANAVLVDLDQRHRDATAETDEPDDFPPATAEDDPPPEEPKPAADDEEDEPPLNAREENVERAYRAVLIGMIFTPVQLYATWVLLDVWKSDLALRPAISRKLRWAIGLHLPLLAFAIFLLWFGSTSLFRIRQTDAILTW